MTLHIYIDVGFKSQDVHLKDGICCKEIVDMIWMKALTKTTSCIHDFLEESADKFQVSQEWFCIVVYYVSCCMWMDRRHFHM
mgnify:FL=1